MECPYCHETHGLENPCMTHSPVPMSYWPTRSGMPEMLQDAEMENAAEVRSGD